MSILIKGMEMPTNCWECPMVSGYEIADDAKTLCSTVRCRLTNTKRPAGEAIAPDCPLVSVPPHGRLIDGDNLALLVLNWISTQEKAYPHEDSNALAWRLGAKAMGNQIYRDIKVYPTIIPAEEGE